MLTSKNGEKLLTENLTYLLEQNYPDLEVVVVNYTSFDNTQYVLQLFKSNYPDRLKIVRFEEDVNHYKGKKSAKQRKRIASRLDGLTPQEVLDLASLKSFFIPRAYIDYAYEEEKEGQNDYKFVADEVKHCFRQGDWVLLIVVGRPDYQFGNIIKVEYDSIFIHTSSYYTSEH